MTCIRNRWLQVVVAMGLAFLCVRLFAAADKAGGEPPGEQVIDLETTGAAYPFAVYSNIDLRRPAPGIERAVVFVHGVQRDADRYFGVGLGLLQAARLDASSTVLLVPHFLTASDPSPDGRIPLWRGGNWMQCQESRGKEAINSCGVLDDIARYLSADKRFPMLKELVFIGHSAGGQLMQRYAVLNNSEEALRKAGIRVRYVVSSPSSYLYLDANRPEGDDFKPVNSILCPGYNNFRYGLANMVPYGQGLDGEQLFKRYAAREVLYLVGAQDNDPAYESLDKSCGAAMQGTDRLNRHRNYMRYEQFLARKWSTPVARAVVVVPDAGHEAAEIFESREVAAKIFPAVGH
ncbi:alpha/beta fold hydrolase [Polaromonas sp. CT11-55]